MTVTFNDVVLANGESRTAKVASGLAPSGAINYEPLEFLRAAWAVPVARGNRLITLPMIIEIPPFATFGAALVGGLTYFGNIPDEGPLVIAEGADQVTFSSAVCVECKILEEIVGLSHAVALRFVCGQPVNATLSRLAQMDSHYPNVISLTGLTGGTTKLDGEITTDVEVGRFVDFYLDVDGFLQPHRWVLTAWTDETEDAEDGRVLPDDFHSTTNPKIWRRLI